MIKSKRELAFFIQADRIRKVVYSYFHLHNNHTYASISRNEEYPFVDERIPSYK